MSRLIPVLAALAAIVPAPSARAAACPGADRAPAAGDLVSGVLSTVCLVNQRRDAAGLPALDVDIGLTVVGTAYARRMVAENFDSHVSPEGQVLDDRLLVIGYHPDVAGENLYWGIGVLDTPAAAVRGWMASAEHRVNVLDPRYRRIGIGIAVGAPGVPGDLARSYVAEFDSGPGPPQIPVAAPGRAGVTAVVRAWIEAARTGDAGTFCRLEDNRLLAASYGDGGPAGIASCLKRLRPEAGLPAAGAIGLSRPHVSSARARVTVTVRGRRGAVSLRKFNGHWKIDSVGG